jgi:manganese/zinc-transporting P-type ATPase C
MADTDNQIKVQHAVNGRIRFKIPAIRFNRTACRQHEALFRDMKGIRGVGANPKSASLVVRYDPRTLSRREVIERIGGHAMAGTTASAGKGLTCSRPAGAARKDSLKPALWRFIALTLLVGVVFVRNVLLKRPFAQTLFSPLGLITSVTALPLVKKGLVKLKEGRVTLESFLGGSIIAAAAAGEATAALEILWITSGGELLQGWITERSRRAIRDILQVTEKETYVLTGGVEVSIPVDQVQPGDTVVLHTGEKIAVDGKITKGAAVIDESPITGRAEPATKAEGAKVFAGTFVRQGVIFVKAEQVGDRTYLARILQMVENSLENKAPIEGVADRLAQNLIKTGFAVTGPGDRRRHRYRLVAGESGAVSHGAGGRVGARRPRSPHRRDRRRPDPDRKNRPRPTQRTARLLHPAGLNPRRVLRAPTQAGPVKAQRG